MVTLRRVLHRGLDELLMGAALLRPMHPPKLQMGPLSDAVHLPAGGVPQVGPLAIPLPARKTRLEFRSPVPGMPPPNDRLILHVTPPKGPSRGVVVFSPFWLIPGPWALAPYVRLVKSLNMHSVLYTPPDHMQRTSKSYFSGERLLSFDFPYMERMLQVTAAELAAVTRGFSAHGLPVFLVGMSLGGLYAAMAALHGAPVDGLALITPAVDMQAPMAKSRLGRHYQDVIKRRGDALPSQDELSRLGLPYRARSFDRPLPADRIFLAHGIHDGVVPLGVATALAHRWQVPLHSYASGHMSLLFLDPAVQRDVRRFLKACLSGRPAALRTTRQEARAARGGQKQARPLRALARAMKSPLATLRAATRPAGGGLPRRPSPR